MTELLSAAESGNAIPTAPAKPAYPQDNLSSTFDAANINVDPGFYGAPSNPASSSLPPTSPASKKTEEDAKAAAEEDKRRRNTAASARFRVKKKQREQALEQREKELNNKVSALERRIGQLEQENGFLKSLIIEKNGKENELMDRYQKFRRESEEVEERGRSTHAAKKGVGTKAA